MEDLGRGSYLFRKDGEGMAVRLVTMPAQDIFNLTSPRWLPEVARYWKGVESWHSARYEPLRDLIETTYVSSFEALTGHYSQLEQSICANGIRNPIVVTTGPLMIRGEDELPTPRPIFVCEYVGGSRLTIAQSMGFLLRVIVNDRANLCRDFHEIKSASEVAALFADAPRTVRFDNRGVYVNHLPFAHYAPADQERRRREQTSIRKIVVRQCQAVAEKWSLENDNATFSAEGLPNRTGFSMAGLRS